MKLFNRSIILLLAGITASAADSGADAASGVRERKVDVGEGVSLRVIEAGQARLGADLGFYSRLEHGRRYLATTDRSFCTHSSRDRFRSAVTRSIDDHNERQHARDARTGSA